MNELHVWPKKLPVLTAEQEKIRDDFMKLWHEVLPARYGIIEKINHGPAVIRKPNMGQRCKTLEIGAGLGAHIENEDLNNQDYTALELRKEMADVIKERFPKVNVLVGDIQKRLNLPDQSFDRILAIHVLEHLPYLPDALLEIKRLLKPDGYFSVVLPCEGGWANSIARRISAQRIFEKKYKMSYDFFIKSEHVNLTFEVVEELRRHFNIEEHYFWPARIPSINFNLVAGYTCTLQAL